MTTNRYSARSAITPLIGLTARCALAALGSLTALPSHHVAAQTTDARAILARYVAATGAATVASRPGLHMTGTFEIAAQGLRGTTEAWYDIPTGRSVQIMSLPGIEMKAGIDTGFAWSMSAYEGPKILEPKEYIEQQEKLDLRTMRRDPAVVLEAVVMERALVDSQPCITLKLKWKSGRETTECYSEATGLLLRSESVETMAAGSLPMTTIYGEYKTFAGLTMATKTVQRAAGLEITQRVTDVTFERVDSTKVTPPPEILVLRKR